ncbi:NADPH oxidase 5 [Trichoplax sp. H2]|nr:NADPH oxidase 5 [Trichoplax sp. H2]|eukprot:RDD42245.1 NADPH oxidase 5 [Trichoplax sp. H2]
MYLKRSASVQPLNPESSSNLDREIINTPKKRVVRGPSNMSLRSTLSRLGSKKQFSIDFKVPAIEWFANNLVKYAKNDRLTIRQFKKAGLELEGFSHQLFRMFASDGNKTVTLQEVIGGIAKLTDRKKKLEWFKNSFTAVCDDDENIDHSQFKKAITSRGFLERFFYLLDGDNSGRVAFQKLVGSLEKLTCLDRDAKWLSWFEQQFAAVAGEDRQINIVEFKNALNVKESFFAERFFQLFDEDGSGTISLNELMGGLNKLTSGDNSEKLRFLFKVYDVDGNGFIDPFELKTVLQSCISESSLEFSESNLNALTQALFESADADGSGTITYEELEGELQKHPGVIENLTISAANWLKPPPKKKKNSLKQIYPYYLTLRYIRNNLSITLFMIVYWLTNFGLFGFAVYQQREKNIWIKIARGCGLCLNFNCTFIMVLMLRKTLTIIRSTTLGSYLPIDQHIDFHKMTGIVIGFFALVHTVAHVFNVVLPDPPNNRSAVDVLFTTKYKIGWVGGTAYITGYPLVIILLVMIICSMPFVRRKGYFQVFYWTHLLFVPWFALLIIHCPNFWHWFIVPGSIYVLERIYRSKFVKLARYGRTYIIAANMLPSKVTHLVINRPSNFHFQPGDYAFLQIPAIAKYAEWHPFTISSAPEQKHTLWFHVRSVGTWTTRLYEYFERKHVEAGSDVPPLLSPKIPKRESKFSKGSRAMNSFMSTNSSLRSFDMTETNTGNSRNSSFNESTIGTPKFSDRNGFKNMKSEAVEIASYGIDNAAFTADDENQNEALETTPLSPTHRQDRTRSSSVDISDQKANKKHLKVRRTRSEAVSDLAREDVLGPIEVAVEKEMQVFSPMPSPAHSAVNSVAPSPVHSDAPSPVAPIRHSQLPSKIHTPVISAQPSPAQSPGPSPVATSFGIELNSLEQNRGSVRSMSSINVNRANSLDRKFSTASQSSVKFSGDPAIAAKRVPNSLQRMSAIQDDLIVAVPLQNDGGVGSATNSGQQLAAGNGTNNGILKPVCPNSGEMRKRQVSIAIPEDYEIRDFQRRRSARKSVVGTKVEVFIDGPYGTPSTHIFQADHAVLIGAGIGVTPFASILQSIIFRYRSAARQVCPQCNYTWTDKLPSSVMNLKKVDFFWINRDQKAFEWFISLLSQLEIEQTEDGNLNHLLDMHMYMTSALRKTDMKAIGLQMALDLIHKKSEKDLITGLRTKTEAGRPDWNQVFDSLSQSNHGKVSVFFCGSHQLGSLLKSYCQKYGFEFRKENF